jgi:hypothetical protein
MTLEKMPWTLRMASADQQKALFIPFYLSVCVCLSMCEEEEEVAKTNQS